MNNDNNTLEGFGEVETVPHELTQLDRIERDLAALVEKVNRIESAAIATAGELTSNPLLAGLARKFGGMMGVGK